MFHGIGQHAWCETERNIVWYRLFFFFLQKEAEYANEIFYESYTLIQATFSDSY